MLWVMVIYDLDFSFLYLGDEIVHGGWKPRGPDKISATLRKPFTT